MNGPISKRCMYDEREVFELTSIQREARNKIRAKLKSGQYSVENVSCPLCESTLTYLLAEKDTYGLPMRTVLCRTCSLVYTNPRLTEKALPEFYGTEYRDLDRVLPSSSAYFDLERSKGSIIFEPFISNNLAHRITGKLVVEIGCGTGGVLAYFREQGFEVLGCDLVPKNLEYGITMQGLDLHYGGLSVVKNIVAEREQQVGLIIYEQVFEHLLYPKAELEELRSFMPRNSLLYIGVPGLRNIDDHYASDFIRFLQLPHLVQFDLDRLSTMLSLSGFSLLVGDEKVRAVFEPAETKTELKRGDYEATLKFLVSLEERRRAKAFWSSLRQLPLLAGLQVRKWIASSFLPASVKHHAILAMKIIYKWVRPKM
ncbi:MAG: class I SAM-dependent methyltransferase [Nitrospira sp.]|jgi:SAM-dependent methyltransferase|nr:class I SAM-dependent methyltransferase [Nitrospira sp.]